MQSIVVTISDQCATYLSSEASQRNLSLEAVAAERLEVGTPIELENEIGEAAPDYLELIRIARASISEPRTTEEIYRDNREARGEATAPDYLAILKVAWALPYERRTSEEIDRDLRELRDEW